MGYALEGNVWDEFDNYELKLMLMALRKLNTLVTTEDKTLRNQLILEIENELDYRGIKV